MNEEKWRGKKLERAIASKCENKKFQIGSQDRKVVRKNDLHKHIKKCMHVPFYRLFIGLFFFIISESKFMESDVISHSKSQEQNVKLAEGKWGTNNNNNNTNDDRKRDRSRVLSNNSNTKQKLFLTKEPFLFILNAYHILR